jgi:predicted ArsR family transcriptional regulator
MNLPAQTPSALLLALKRHGPLTLRALAQELEVSYEAVRQQMAGLVRIGWVTPVGGPRRRTRTTRDGDPQRAGRPGPAAREYRLSAAAEPLFPKHYDELSLELVQHVLGSFGGAGLKVILERMTEARVQRWAPLLAAMTWRRKLQALTALYADQDAHMRLEWREGSPALIVSNCPFLNVAQAHPAICSVSVNTLERLLGCRVVREQRFQAGDGRCVFRFRPQEPRPRDAAFTLEA